ncbi:MAG: 3-hydroxyacyl-ACP dehydratase FabZ [Vampirovibrionales bacterium]
MIQTLIPHRYPFLLLDRVEALTPGQHAVGYKCVSMNEWYFQGHFPERPLMPGVLITEALAQLACVCVQVLPEYKGRLGVFSGIDGMRFRRMVQPGDLLKLEVTVTALRKMLGKAHAIATVEGQIVAEGDVMFSILPSTVSMS